MKQNSYENSLKDTVAPQPDPQARLLAKRAAVAEFKRIHAAADPALETVKPGFFQALSVALRLSRGDQSHGDDVMRWNSRSRMFAGAASICVAVIGFAVIWPMVRNGDSAVLLDKPLAESVTVEAVRSEVPGAEPAAAAAATNAAESIDATSRPPVAKREVPAPVPALAVGQERGQVAPGAAPKLATAPPREIAPAPAAMMAESRTDPPAPQGAAAAIDAISAEDIGQVSDASVSAEIARNPGVSVNRLAVPTAPPVAPKQSGKSEEKLQSMTVAGARKSKEKRAAADKDGAAAATDRRVRLPIFPRANEAFAALEAEGRDQFEHFDLNAVKQAADEPHSTFSADVDTTSYSFVRKQLNAGVLPQKDSVRSEEMINYFGYAWPAAESRERPFRPTVVVSDSPWGKGRKLVHIGIKGYELDARQRPDANLVLLLDVSGSMASPDKLPLVKESMRLIVNGLKPTDTVAIVVYAGAAGTVLPPTPVGEKEKILSALDRLESGGSTAGAAGIELAYRLAEQSFRKDGVNRILLCTDGDFNVGIDNTNELKGFVERKREKGIFLSVLGFGQGNYRDELAQALAQNGNGVAAYIDTLSEAQKVLVQEAGSSLFTIAKDVKLQVEFNPATVAEYRLVGYETRALKREDFNNDAVDAGDVGSGHTVTAIYEITPVGVDARRVEPSRYAKTKAPVAESSSGNEYGFLRVRYKLPQSSQSQLIEQPILVDQKVTAAISREVQFSTAVAGFAQLLRGGQYTGSLGYEDVIKQALAARGEDPFGYRNEFVQLVRRAQSARGM